MYIVVRGCVQGVSFRAYTQQRARALGLNGYVRNLADGGVEIVVEGEEDSLEQLLAWARHGPSGAVVSDIRVEYTDAKHTFSDFSIRY